MTLRPRGRDWTGHRFGALVVVRYVRGGHPDGPIWLVRCTCGRTEERRSTLLAASERAGHRSRCTACEERRRRRAAASYRAQPHRWVVGSRAPGGLVVVGRAGRRMRLRCPRGHVTDLDQSCVSRTSRCRLCAGQRKPPARG